VKLNIGCGGQIAEGWVNLDLHPTVPGAAKGDILRLNETYRPGSFHVIVAHHVLDLLREYRLVVHALWQCRSVVTPDGVMRVSCADINGALAAANRGDTAWFVGQDPNDDAGKLLQVWMGWRKLLLTPDIVLDAATKAGWTGGTKQPDSSRASVLDTRLRESWFVELYP